MSWFNTEGACPQFYLWSKTRYLRNPAKLPFRRGGDQLSEILQSADRLLTQNGFRMEVLPTGLCSEVCALAEKHLVDEDFITSEGERALYLNEPCNLAVAVGGRDLFSVSSVLSGRAISESRNVAAGAEELLDGEFEMAYDESIGYLSPDPLACGSCAVFSAALYLPSLSAGEGLSKLRAEYGRAGVEITPMSLYGGNPGDIYLLSRRIPLSCSEDLSAAELEAVCERIVQNEKSALRMIYADGSKLIIDRAWRAFGTLLYARRIPEEEFLSLLSELRLAAVLTEDKSLLPPVGFVTLNSLLAEGLNASVAASAASVCLCDEDCERARAGLVSERLAPTNSL